MVLTSGSITAGGATDGAVGVVVGWSEGGTATEGWAVWTTVGVADVEAGWAVYGAGYGVTTGDSAGTATGAGEAAGWALISAGDSAGGGVGRALISLTTAALPPVRRI
eukprot:sb/3477569/